MYRKMLNEISSSSLSFGEIVYHNDASHRTALDVIVMWFRSFSMFNRAETAPFAMKDEDEI